MERPARSSSADANGEGICRRDGQRVDGGGGPLAVTAASGTAFCIRAADDVTHCIRFESLRTVDDG